ncbi:MAG: OmpA family protein [Saprospiraceae bacterium]|nr:OmpA family protein [Saprospiraceae bacterium]MDW8229153.1 OmpA family protein [Saprospiraceae bacterium]
MKFFFATLLLAVLLLMPAPSWAQPRHSFALRPTLYNYHAPLRDNSPSFSDIFGKNSGGGVELTYYRRLLPNMLLGLPLRVGAAQTDPRSSNAGQREWLLHADVLAQQHFLRPTAGVQPYLHAGIGGVYNFEQQAFGIHFPVGVGLNVRIVKNVYLTAQTQHRFANDNRDVWHHAIGIQFNFGKELPTRRKEQPTPDKPADRDGDGVLDTEDRCPDQPGLATTFGCPDRDSDGIADRDDRCPDEPGPATLSGCPDRDGDGLADRDDRCPDKPGPASNFGCPEVSQADRDILAAAVRNVQFATNSANLLPSSNAVLDQVAALMARYPEYRLVISGHTDSVGDDKFNLDLSKRRAKACYDYLVSKGVDPRRMTHEGYGETRPIADNNTEAGRARNRRVEFELRLQ